MLNELYDTVTYVNVEFRFAKFNNICLFFCCCLLYDISVNTILNNWCKYNQKHTWLISMRRMSLSSYISSIVCDLHSLIMMHITLTFQYAVFSLVDFFFIFDRNIKRKKKISDENYECHANGITYHINGRQTIEI